MAITVRLPAIFKKIQEDGYNNNILYGGRLGGKTNNTAKIAILEMLANPYNDVVVARVSYGSLADSSYAEVEAAIRDMGDNISEEFHLKKSPLRIERKGNSGTIYFIGYGGSNTSRTKSFKPKHKIKVVILEETQELKDEQNLNEALASLRRHYGENVRVYILGNPKPQMSHWFSKFIDAKTYDSDWGVYNLTYKDILPFINDYDLREILKTKIVDYEYYKWFYLGDRTGGFGSVYPMFKLDKHVITAEQWSTVQERTNIRPVACLIGGDGAVNRDCTSFVPLILLNNGQCVVGPIFYHNPVTDGVVGYHQLVQNLLVFWLEDVLGMFRLGTLRETRTHPYMQRVPVWMRIDNAAADLIQECRFFLSDRCSVDAVKKGTVPDMVSTVQSAILNENIIIIDYGGYKSYTKNQWIKTKINLLAEQWETLTWNEKQDNYDPIIPNDVSDAATYAVITWFKNPENIQYFNIAKIMGKQTKLIRDIITPKE